MMSEKAHRYELVEKEWYSVPVVWKASHILSLAVASVLSVLTNTRISSISSAFDENCVLHSTVSLTNNTDLTYKSVGNFSLHHSFLSSNTTWGDSWRCDCCSFILQCDFVTGFILMLFFIITPKGGANRDAKNSYEKAWRLLCPSTFISIVILTCTIFAYALIQEGYLDFCEQFSIDDSCTDIINHYTLVFNEGEVDVYDVIAEVVYFSKFTTAAWGVAALLLLVRMVLGIDFMVRVFDVPSDDEGLWKSNGVNESEF